MQKKKGSRPNAADQTTLAPHLWPGLPLLNTVQLLNQRCIEHLANLVDPSSPVVGSPATEVLHEFRTQITARVCERAARCPILLMSLNFNRSDWWGPAENSVQKPLHLDTFALFTKEVASTLLREILVEAWSLGRTMPRETSLIFGMTPAVTKAIVGLSVQEIDHVTANHAVVLRPRWEQCRTFWRGLLRAAIGSDDEALINAQLHSLSLLWGDRPPLRGSGNCGSG